MIEVFGLSYYENPLWLRMIGKFKGILFVMAIVYILCFTSSIFLVTLLEIDIASILGLEFMFYMGFWLLAASIWIFFIGWILRSRNCTDAIRRMFQAAIATVGGYL
ncbi:MAG: hypothetical protein QXZ70_05480 [Candidatus Bathyarchaeia archaeon]